MPIKYKKRIDVTINVKIIDPIAPEYVLLGLILVNLGPPIIFPKVNPPISEDMQPNKRIYNIILNPIKLEKIKNSRQKIKI